jgi:serine protease inhibitor
MWYIEHEKFQMVDLPYLNSNFVATLILPRVSSDRTIQDHPEEFEYDKIKRQASTVHDVLALLAAPHSSGIDVFSHHARYMAPMKGLVGVPGFTADYVMSEKDAGGQSDERHRAVLSISPHGLDVGVKTLRTRANHLGANFTALFDHPFLFFLRSTRPDAPQILFAGVVKDVFERRDWSTKYPLPQEWADFKEEIGRKIAGMYAQQQQQQQATGGAR